MDANIRNLNGELLPVTYFAVRTASGEKGEKPYASIGMTESTIISKTFDFSGIRDGRTDISPLAILPYFITDSVNEMGLAVSELTLFGNDLHYFVLDANGDYAILEWVKDSAEGGRNSLQVVRDIPYISNLFCSAKARELSNAGRFENENRLFRFNLDGPVR